jgi:hypothetical protein
MVAGTVVVGRVAIPGIWPAVRPSGRVGKIGGKEKLIVRGFA